jgi:hypothetical protein
VCHVWCDPDRASFVRIRRLASCSTPTTSPTYLSPRPIAEISSFLQVCWHKSVYLIAHLSCLIFLLALYLGLCESAVHARDPHHLYILANNYFPFPGSQTTTQQDMLRPGIHPPSVISPPFPPPQHGQSTPSQPHNLSLLPGTNQNMNYLQNTHSSNAPFHNPNLARVLSNTRQRDIHTQSQRATAGGAQTGPSVVNGGPPQPSGVPYPGMAPQNGQGQVHRVVAQSVGVSGPLTSHPNSHSANISNPALGLTGSLQGQRSGQHQQSMGIRPGPGQPSMSQIRPPGPMPSMPSGGGMRNPGGMGVNMTTGIMSNVPQQTQQQQGFHSALGMSGAGPQPPPQGPQGTAAAMSQSMHRAPEGPNSFSGMPGFPNGPFPQSAPHPPASHIAPPNSANQFGFMHSSSSPSPHMDMGHSLSSGGAGPSGTSPPRPDFTVTPAQVASMQYGPGTPSGSGGSGTNEALHTFTTVPPQRPPSSSHSALGLAHQQAQTPQGLSHPTPPRQQTPLQQPQQISQAHLPERINAPTANPIRPRSQPQRPSSQQQMGRSLTPRMPHGTLPPNATLLQGHHPASISGGSAPPPQPRSMIGTGVGPGPPPLTAASSAENGDLSRQPGVPGIHPPMPKFVFNQWPSRFVFSPCRGPSHAPTVGFGQALTHLLQFSGALAAEDQKVCPFVCGLLRQLITNVFSF